MRLGTTPAGILMVGMLLVAGQSVAQPQIEYMTGSVTDGSSVTLQGELFGQKVPAAPLRYDNFQNGTIGGALPTQSEGGWYYQAGTRQPAYSNARQRLADDMCVLQDYSEDYNKTIGLFRTDVDTLYITGWTYRDDYAGTAMNSENQKLWGNWGKFNVETGYGMPQCRVDTYFANGSGHMYAQDGNQDVMFNQSTNASMLDQWFRLERFMAMGTPSGNNGHTFVKANLQTLAEYRGSLYTTGEPYDYWVLGHYFSRTNGALLRVYWSELYVDNTLARIEMGNAPTWNACTHREIQIPSAWGQDTVTFTVNQGTFLDGESVFLFVVDENDEPSPGFEVIVAGGSDEDGPGQPSTVLLQ